MVKEWQPISWVVLGRRQLPLGTSTTFEKDFLPRQMSSTPRAPVRTTSYVRHQRHCYLRYRCQLLCGLACALGSTLYQDLQVLEHKGCCVFAPASEDGGVCNKCAVSRKLLPCEYIQTNDLCHKPPSWYIYTKSEYLHHTLLLINM
jgi:hypothetical protein